MPGDSHDSVKELMRARGLVDVLIPRGGAGLIRSVVEESTVPVIETGVGNCHVYVDADADLDMAERIVLNAKTHRTSVCNAAESLLVHRDVAEEFVPRIVRALQDAGVTVHGDESFARQEGVAPATDEDWGTEYLALEISAAVVPSLDAAIEHIRRYSSAHSDAIVTDSQSSARGSWPRSTRQRCSSTPRPGSPTAVSSASGPRSGSRRRSCTPVARWASPR